ncbi:MAG: cupin domain-containing protein [Verrucomicrobiales bacterium]|nr:cupin domain-containing protein [Verrucomicrobiales bacterium]
MARTPLCERGIAREAATALARWPLTVSQPLTVTATGHAILQYLPDNLAASPSAALRALDAVAARLPWRYNYAPGRGGNADAGRVAWAEFIGPAAPIVSDELCVGVTLIAPRTLYPAHRHPAAELYYVLGGTARWQSPAADGDRAPGEFIFHPPNVVHAMETRDEPLLAAYTWTGDVRALSQYV